MMGNETTRRRLVSLANVLEHLGLALMIGGMLALGALVAPALFHNFPREDAARVMSLIFRRHDVILTVSIFFILFGEVMRLIIGGFSAQFLPRARYVTTIVLTVLTLFSLFVINPRIETLRSAGVVRGVGPQGMQLDRIHHNAESLYKAELGIAILLLIFVSLPVKPPRET